MYTDKNSETPVVSVRALGLGVSVSITLRRCWR